VIGNCKRTERFKVGGWRRQGFLCSLDTGRLMGVLNWAGSPMGNERPARKIFHDQLHGKGTVHRG
jgi:hypothetical protein